MKQFQLNPRIFALSVFCVALLDAGLFFFAERQIITATLALFCLQLFPLASPARIGALSALLSLQAFLFFSDPLSPLIYLLPSILVARLTHGKLYENLLPAAGTFAACLGTHIWLFQPYMLDSARHMTCTLAGIFGIIGGAWIVSLTLRKQGGRGNRPRP